MRKFLSAALILCLMFLFGGCAAQTEAEPLETRVSVRGDFKITLSSMQSVYQSGENPELELLVEYIGEGDEVTIYRGDPIGIIEIKTPDGDMATKTPDGEPAGYIIHDILMTDVIRKSEPVSIKWNADLFAELEKGDYIAEAYVSFGTDEKLNDSIECTLELPFSIQ